MTIKYWSFGRVQSVLITLSQTKKSDNSKSLQLLVASLISLGHITATNNDIGRMVLTAHYPHKYDWSITCPLWLSKQLHQTIQEIKQINLKP